MFSETARSRAGTLLGQEDIGAARIVLERAAENGQRAGALHARRERAIRMGAYGTRGEAHRACATSKGGARDWASPQLVLHQTPHDDDISDATSRPSLQCSADPSIAAGIRVLFSLSLDRQQEPADLQGDDS